MTPVTIGRFVSGFYPTWDAAEYGRLIAALDLPRDRKIGAFSGGMKARLALALALAPRPRLLVLDEPMAGLDPVARREFLEMVRDQAERTGRTTLFSSHVLAEVERAADRVGIIDAGRMCYEGDLKELSDRIRLLRRPWPAHAPGAAEADTAPDGPPPAALPPRLSIAAAAGAVEILHDRVRKGERQVVVRSANGSGAAFEGLLEGAGDWWMEAMGLEDIFVELVSHPPDAPGGRVRATRAASAAGAQGEPGALAGAPGAGRVPTP
jgi:ABC-2 type transport system ATP-binding protein